MHIFDNNLFELLENMLLLLLCYYFVVAAIIISDTRFISRQPKVAAAAIKFCLLSRLVDQAICYYFLSEKIYFFNKIDYHRYALIKTLRKLV